MSVKELSLRWIERGIERSSQALFQARQDRIGNWKGSNKRKATDSRHQAPGTRQDQERRKGGGGGGKGNRSLLLVVHGVHGIGSVIIGSVANETETTAAAGVAVLDDGLENKRVRLDAIGRSEGQNESTYSLLNNTEFLEALAQRLVVCAPGETAGNRKSSVTASTTWKSTYPMKSLDMLIKVTGLDEGRDRRLEGVSVKRGIAELDLKYGFLPGPEQHLAMSRALIFQANFIFCFFCFGCISIVASLFRLILAGDAMLGIVVDPSSP